MVQSSPSLEVENDKNRLKMSCRLRNADQLKLACDLMEAAEPLISASLRGEDLHQVLAEMPSHDLLEPFNLVMTIESATRGKKIESAPLDIDDDDFFQPESYEGIALVKELFQAIPFVIRASLCRMMQRENTLKEILKDLIGLPLESAIDTLWQKYLKDHEDSASSVEQFLQDWKNDPDKARLNCEARAKLLLIILRRKFNLDLFFTTDYSTETEDGHIVLVFFKDGKYYGIDNMGIIQLNKPPTYLDPPEVMLIHWYLESVLGE